MDIKVEKLVMNVDLLGLEVDPNIDKSFCEVNEHSLPLL